MIDIIPALMPKTKEELHALLARVGHVDAVQLDVMDGAFVPETSYPYGPEGLGPVERLPDAAHALYELDLMIERPAGALAALAKLGARRAIFHVESDTAGGIELAMRAAKDLGMETWVAIGSDTPLSALESFYALADGIQLMGIARIGYQGQPFDSRVLERLETLRTLRPKLPRSVDGAVNHETIERLVTAGATRLVAGSAILAAARPSEAIEKLKELI